MDNETSLERMEVMPSIYKESLASDDVMADITLQYLQTECDIHGRLVAPRGSINQQCIPTWMIVDIFIHT